MFTKGMEKVGGRTAGTCNRLTGAFREAVLLAFDGIGGHQAFTAWARDNPSEFYKIAARLIPVEIKDSSAGTTIIIDRAKALGPAALLPDQSNEDDPDTQPTDEWRT